MRGKPEGRFVPFEGLSGQGRRAGGSFLWRGPTWGVAKTVSWAVAAIKMFEVHSALIEEKYRVEAYL